MGLLTDPSLTPRNQIGRNLGKHSLKICTVLYLGGLAWFICLSHPHFHNETYLSENALSPGLVYPEVKQDQVRFMKSLMDELDRERQDHKSFMPYSWIIAKMKQIGLETHIHNFTLNYPYGEKKEFHGKNIYGILRAPRIGSTEGIVFSAPYRPPSSVHMDISHSVPVLLAFADFARNKNYWAKDLVFLVTEQEQLGIHAWLEAYHEGGIAESTMLNSGDLPARAGALQAAINLEIQDLFIDYIDVKLEGLNGQLPNLDLFNLVQRIAAREQISSGYKQTPKKKRQYNTNKMQDNLRDMIEMLLSQSTGVPTGNHGLFHRYRIEAVTLEVVKTPGKSFMQGLNLLKTIEGISRSLNNLLERFHQSFFFYILMHNDRFVSIGDFIPCLIALVSTLFIKAFLLWLSLDNIDGKNQETLEQKQTLEQKESLDQEETTKNTDEIEEHTFIPSPEELPYEEVLKHLGSALLLGISCYAIPQYHTISNFMANYSVSTTASISTILGIFALVGYLLPFFHKLPTRKSRILLQIATLIFFGANLIVIGLLNFALGFLIAIVYVPLLFLINTEDCAEWRRGFTQIYAFLLNPIIIVYAVVFLFTVQQFPELSLIELLPRALTASMDAITFSLMDRIIYGNWLYTIITIVIFPFWILSWKLTTATLPVKHQKTD